MDRSRLALRAPRTQFRHLWLLPGLVFLGCGRDGEDSGGSGSGGAFGSGGTDGSAAGGSSPAGGAASGDSGGGALASGGAAAGGALQNTGGALASGGASSGGALVEGSGGDQASTGGSASGSGGASSDGATIVPDASWTCGMPEGIVDPKLGELVFDATLEVGDVYDIGLTQYGERRVLDIQGGAFTGENINASFLSGGLDMELTLSNGAIELEQVNVIRTGDGAVVYLRTCGVAQAGDTDVRIVADFEAPNSSSVAFLNTGTFVGVRSFDQEKSELRLAIYDVTDVEASGPSVTLVDPEDLPDQPWECAKHTGNKGTSVFTETVTLGGSLSVGASKRGSRNIIPITGGSVSGRFVGEVLPGGADYQLIGGTTTLDARYTLKSNDNEFLLVRNCGPFGALIPWFEARAEGPYAFLNDGQFLSSDPGSAGGGVSITFYERQ